MHAARWSEFDKKLARKVFHRATPCGDGVNQSGMHSLPFSCGVLLDSRLKKWVFVGVLLVLCFVVTPSDYP